MVLSEHEDLDTWLDFVSLCRNGGNRFENFIAFFFSPAIAHASIISALAERVLSMSQHALPGSAPGSNSGEHSKLVGRIQNAYLV